LIGHGVDEGGIAGNPKRFVEVDVFKKWARRGELSKERDGEANKAIESERAKVREARELLEGNDWDRQGEARILR